MGRHVVLVASGETERHALPRLLGGASASLDVRTTRHGKITADDTAKIITAAYWEGFGRGKPPDKAIVLVDADGRSPESILPPLEEEIARRLKRIPISLLLAHAQWHLEAWFFGDAQRLQEYLKRDVGNIDPSLPDEIRMPKAHLKNLLGDDVVYTARVAGEIADVLDPEEISKRSPSFAGLIGKVRNGTAS